MYLPANHFTVNQTSSLIDANGVVDPANIPQHSVDYKLTYSIVLYLDSKSPSRFKEGANQFAEILKLPTLPLLPILLTKNGGIRLESVINGCEKVIHEYRMDENDTTVLTHASRIDPHYPKMLARWFDKEI